MSDQVTSTELGCVRTRLPDSRCPLRLEWHHRGQFGRGQELTLTSPGLGNQRGDARSFLGACLEFVDLAGLRLLAFALADIPAQGIEEHGRFLLGRKHSTLPVPEHPAPEQEPA